MDIYDVRRRNLRTVIEQDFDNVPARLAAAVGCQQTTISRLYSTSGSARNVGDKLARQIEIAAGREIGWLDVQHDQTDDHLLASLRELSDQERNLVEAFLLSLRLLRPRR